ncbi:MAG: formate dehydrogenase subunit alpha [Thermodesulfatator sp.]|nr:MAG: formate dehydrogenase subunit alpha [Thermodesulfatator sp.]
MAKGARLVVIDPRKTDLAAIADEQEDGVWLRLRPGTNIPLLNAILHVIIEEGLEDKKFIQERTEGFDALKEQCRDYSPERMAQLTDVAPELIRKAARLYASSENSMILYGLGVTEHKGGTAGVMALANLVLATGHVGRPHNGINPLRGQNNVQGACDMGTLPYIFPGYLSTDDSEARERFARAWGVKALPEGRGLMEPQMYDAALKGNFKALYCVGYDPVQTQSDISRVQRAFHAMEFVVVQDMFLTETAKLAHVVLPSTCFYEKEGTFTSGERRVRKVNKVINPKRRLKADWEIICLISQAMGYPMIYTNPVQIMTEIAKLTPSYGGISYQDIGQTGQVWPCPEPGHAGTPLLHTEKFPGGKANFVPVSYIVPEEEADKDYPLVFVTGRRLEHYNNGSMTRRCQGFDQIAPYELLEVHPSDASALGIQDGQRVRVESRRGSIKAVATVTKRSRPGTVFMTFHFQDNLTNLLTSPGMDNKTLTPEYKVCAVRIRT